MALLKRQRTATLQPVVDRGGFVSRPQQTQRLPPCIANCPSGTDIRGWIATVAQRTKLGYGEDEAYTLAWRTIVERNPFPASMGRVCPHPCETACNRRQKEGAVAINGMERFIGDWALQKRLPLTRLVNDVKGESIGVIGAGPSGLSFAYQMARRGYQVTIYERSPSPGGMLRYGIPRYRLPSTVLDAEIRRIIDLGIELKTRCAVGTDISLDELRSRHTVLFVGIGAQRGLNLGVPGETGAGVWSGTAFLRKSSLREPVDLGPQVAIIGGGDTAFDTARTARRQGAQATVLYRRGREEMPAGDEEVEDAIAENVSIGYLLAPKAILLDGSSVRSLVVQKMELGERDQSGRRSPRPVEGSEYEIPVTAVIAAVSQEPDWDGLDEINPKGKWIKTDPAGRVGECLWAGGDVVRPATASTAICQGRLAAESVHAVLRGVTLAAAAKEAPITHEKLHLDYYQQQTAVSVPRRPADLCLAQPESELRCTITAAQFQQEASRCLSCGSCFGCQHCFMYCDPCAFSRSPAAKPGGYFTLSVDKCEGCTKCVEVCPCGFLEPEGRQPALRGS